MINEATKLNAEEGMDGQVSVKSKPYNDMMNKPIRCTMYALFISIDPIKSNEQKG